MTGLLDPFTPAVGTPAAHRPPTPRAVLRRPRLLEALAEERPLVVVVAPAGYGKTTALSEWCRHHPRPCAWLTLDDRHDDPRVLLRAIGGAVDAALERAADG